MSNFDVLDALLVRVEAEAYASECHGFVCGQICGSGRVDNEFWMEFLDVQGDEEDLIRSCYEEVEDMCKETALQMESAEFGLQLLLPDDVVAVHIRAESLANWCLGFLHGYGVSVAEHVGTPSEECMEVLEDFTQISRLSLEETDTDDEPSLMELEEYVRMGAILIYEELHPVISRPEVLH